MDNNERNTSTKKSYAFPYLTMGVTLLLTVVTIIWLGISNYYAIEMLNSAVEKSMKSVDLIGKIMLYDEALTMSARMNAMTGNKEWEERYNYYDPLLTKAIRELETLTPAAALAETTKTTNAANDELVEIERKSFDLCKLGNTAEAKKVLFNLRYNTLKSIYKSGMDKFQAIVSTEAQQRIAREIKIQQYEFIFMIVSFMLIIISWYFTYKKIYAWKQDLDKSSMIEDQQKIAIIQANKQFENILSISDAIGELSERLQSSISYKEACKLAGHTCEKLLPGFTFSICIYNSIENAIISEQDCGGSHILKGTFDINDCWSLRSGRLYHVDKHNNNIPCNHFKSYSQEEYLCTPMLNQGGVVGVFVMVPPPDVAITNRERMIAVKLTAILCLGLSNISLREKLSDQAELDPLTGLFNRRSLEKNFPARIQRAIRTNNHICVAMLDVDLFKTVNDTYGHDAGDVVLIYIAKILKTRLRESDTIYRYGGDEFLIIMESSPEDSLAKLNDICHGLQNACIRFGEKTLPALAISVGMIEVPTHADNVSDIMRLADQMLYKAKANGRNQIVVYDDSDGKKQI